MFPRGPRRPPHPRYEPERGCDAASNTNAPADPRASQIGNWRAVGYCPKCGAPIWSKVSQYISDPPLPISTFTCECRNGAHSVIEVGGIKV